MPISTPWPSTGSPSDWRSCALTEANLPEWSDTLVRHWLYDAAEELRWQLFAGSSVQHLADISVRAASEERFHRRHGDALLDVLLTVDDARDRLIASLHKLLPVALTLFDGPANRGRRHRRGCHQRFARRAASAVAAPGGQPVWTSRLGCCRSACTEPTHATTRRLCPAACSHARGPRSRSQRYVVRTGSWQRASSRSRVVHERTADRYSSN